MARRKLTPISFRGIGLNTIGRTSFFDLDEGAYNSPLHSPVSVDKQGDFPSFLRLQPGPKTFPLRIVIKSKAKLEQFRAISRIFDPSLGEGTLILEDNSCSPVQQFRLQVAPQQIVVEERTDSAVVVPLFAANPILEDSVADSVTDTITASFIQLTIRNDGSYPTDRLIFDTVIDSDKLPAEGYTLMEEIAYANRSEFSLTGPGSGTWMLLVREGWDTEAEILAGDMESDGRDIAVFVDEVQVPPEKVSIRNIDTVFTKVWIEISDSPAQFADLKESIAGGDLTFNFIRGDHGFRVGDYLVWINDAAATEQARVTSVGDRSVLVERGLRNTTAGASAAATRIFRSGHHIQLAWNYIGVLDPRPTNPDIPLIDLDISNNLGWDWTNAPMWPDDDRRPGGFRRILYNGREDVPELRKNRLSAKTTLIPFGATATWQDRDPTAAAPNFDAIEFTACCGIDDVLGAIEYDAAVDWPFAFQIIGRDLLGYDAIVFNRVGHELGGPSHFPPRLYTNQQETPDGILSAVIFRARNMIVTSVRAGDGTAETLEPINTIGQDSQSFHIDAETQIVGMVARIRDTVGGGGVRVSILEVDDDGAPGLEIIGVTSGAGGFGAGFIEVCFFTGIFSAFTTDLAVLGPGDYHFSIPASDLSGNIQSPKSFGSIYAKGSHYERPTATTWLRLPDEDLWFSILSLTADNQEEVLDQPHSGEFIVLDDVHFTFDPDRTPIVTPAAEENAYYFDTSWAMDAEGFRLRFLRRTADLGATLITVDLHEQTVVESKFGDNLRAALTNAGGSDPWMEAEFGDNTLTIRAEDGAQGERHIVGVRSTWLA